MRMGAKVREWQCSLALADTSAYREARLTRRGNSHLIRRQALLAVFGQNRSLARKKTLQLRMFVKEGNNG